MLLNKEFGKRMEYRITRTKPRDVLSHSKKGSTWKDHKYIKKVDGTYYYPKDSSSSESNKEADSLLEKFYGDIDTLTKNNQAYWDPNEEFTDPDAFKDLLNDFSGIDGNKLSPDQLSYMMKKVNERNGHGKTESSGISDSDVDNLVKEVMKGSFGNGKTRKELLGKNYDRVQSKVNELLKGKVGKKKL